MPTLPPQPAAVPSDHTDAHSLYHTDPYTWSQLQVEALRRRDYDAIDLEHVIEEIGDVGGRHRDMLRRHYARALQHFLKLQYRHPSDADSDRGWQNTITQARSAIHTVLHSSPGLNHHKEQVLAAAWKQARREAINAFSQWQTDTIKDLRDANRENKRLTREWDLILPRDNPYTLQQVQSDFRFPQHRTLSRRPASRGTSHPTPEWNR